MDDPDAPHGNGDESEEYNPFDKGTDKHRAFRGGWESAPEWADMHFQVEDSPEGDAFLDGMFARLSHEDTD